VVAGGGAGRGGCMIMQAVLVRVQFASRDGATWAKSQVPAGRTQARSTVVVDLRSTRQAHRADAWGAPTSCAAPEGTKTSTELRRAGNRFGVS
jgi:hypothetical protein